MARRLALLVFTAALVAAACGDDPQTEETTTSAPPAAPALGPADIVFEAQESDGTTIVVASVTLPSPGFIAVHGDGGGGPGPVVGHSDLLPAGTSTDVAVTLDTPLEATGLLFPMVHIDVDGDGVYDFFPPDETTDSPGLTAEGEVAVTSAEVTVVGAAAADIVIQGFDFGDPITVATGVEVRVRNEDSLLHTWTSSDGVFDSGTLSSGEEFLFTFDTPGVYDFFCAIHPATMAGTITVTG